MQYEGMTSALLLLSTSSNTSTIVFLLVSSQLCTSYLLWLLSTMIKLSAHSMMTILLYNVHMALLQTYRDYTTATSDADDIEGDTEVASTVQIGQGMVGIVAQTAR
jgi:hypothetical protein